MAEGLSILLMAPDQDQAAAITEQLVLDPGLSVSTLRNPPYFSGPLEAERYDLALGLGASIKSVDDLRIAGYRGPVLVLAREAIVVDGVDYLPLPTRVSILLARIRSVIRSFEAREDPWLTIGAFRLMLGSKTLIGPDGLVQKLTDKETDILRFMHRAGGEIVTREVLLAEVWGYNARVSTHTLETHIYRLRQKIELDPANAGLLVTEAGGYRLVEGQEGKQSNGA